MPLAALELSVRQGPVILLGGMVSLFACSRVLVAILPRGPAPIGMRSIAFFIPIAVASLIAMLLGRPEIAVGIVFGTSVGAMTTVVGFIAVGGPVEAGPARWRRLWPFQLAAALLAFVAGFKGTLNWRDAIALATEGVLLLSLWNDKSDPNELTAHDVLEEADAGGTFREGAIPLNYVTATADPGRAKRNSLLIVELGLTAVLLWLGAWAVTQGTIRTGALLRGMSTSGLAGSVVSLSLVLPMMYGTWRQSAGGHGWMPVTTQIGVVLLNLCALLPVLIVMPYVAARVPELSHWAGDAMLWHEGLPRLLLFPSPMWRIDNVMLIIVGVLLLPVGLGKWSLGREEGMVLIAAYFFYLTATVAGGL